MARLLILLLISLSCQTNAAQDQPGWSAAELASSCVPVGESALEARAEDCRVREFGRLAEFGGKETWYALYSNFPEPRAEAAAGSSLDFANVFVLFEAASGSDQLVPLRLGNPEGDYWQQFATPKLLTTAIGPVIHIRGWGMGDGRGQFTNHRYLLWQDNAWVDLDAFAWIRELSMLLPSGYQLDGIYSDPDLLNLHYRGPVRRDEDCHNCATGGTVDVFFKLEGNSLQLDNMRYDPDALWVAP